ncbi:hypothetical protein COUCH_26370 [Couchioplanes caeruleus]|uniref:hypothetical protein n=1 Tax=Couchioplanes caeruleus TaxID=56438 RepID=UPI0020BFDA1D|nr:hypothetical protein [Couchioplanes caeruleus]UQU62542.1 hypothetical protein COUCH_26370 [Couchioplanes caeruleus]
MNDNETASAESPDSLTPPAGKGIPLARAFQRAAAGSPNRAGAPLAALFPQAAALTSAMPHVVVSPAKVVVVRRRQQVMSRSAVFRAHQRLIDRRLTRSAREAAGRARRAPSRESRLRGAFMAGWAGTPEGRQSFLDEIAPSLKVLNQITDMIRPLAWLEELQETLQSLVRPLDALFEEVQQALQSLVWAPMFKALRRIQEQIATAAWPVFSITQRIRDAVTSSASWLTGAFRHPREWASGFMTYQAKLRQQVSSMIDSWSWKLPGFTEVIRPITEGFATILRDIRWPEFRFPDWSAVTEALFKLAVRAVFWAAVRVRRAILREENSEEIVREFMLEFLDLFPKGQPHIEAAKEALLEDAWLKAEPENVKTVLLKRIRELHRNHRLIGDTELGYRRLVSLHTPLGQADSDAVLTLAEALADPRSVEDLVLSLPEFRDPRIDRVLDKLKPGEREVADLYAVHDGMTWDLAAAAAGQPPAFGERVRRKLDRLGKDFTSRQAGGLRIPTTTRPRTRPAFG